MPRARPLLVYAALFAAPAAIAHHSGAAYDMRRMITIEGTVTALSWKNPHITVTIETTGADGAARLQEIEVMSVSQARGLGLRRESISEGAHVVMRAAPSRRAPGDRAFGIAVTTSDGLVMPLSSFARFSAAPSPVVSAAGLAGTWAPTVDSFTTVVAAGAAAPLTESGRAARDEVLARYVSPGGADSVCQPEAPPLLHVFPDPRTIDVTDTAVVIRSEMNGVKQERIVHLDENTHPADLEPTIEGHSIGRWDGETLVIDTIAFAPARTPDLVLLPTPTHTHLVERLTLMEDRRHLEYVFTLEIPGYLAEAVTFRAIWDHRPDLEATDDVCDPETARRTL